MFSIQIKLLVICLCYAHITSPIPHKLAPHARRCIFIGYGVNMKRYRCYDLTNRQVYISKHVTFIKDEFPYQVSLTTKLKESTSKISFGLFSNPTNLDVSSPLPLSTLCFFPHFFLFVVRTSASFFFQRCRISEPPPSLSCLSLLPRARAAATYMNAAKTMKFVRLVTATSNPLLRASITECPTFGNSPYCLSMCRR